MGLKDFGDLHDKVTDILKDAPKDFKYKGNLKIKAYDGIELPLKLEMKPFDEKGDTIALELGLKSKPVALKKLELSPSAAKKFKLSAGDDFHGISGLDLTVSGDPAKLGELGVGFKYDKIADTILNLNVKPSASEATLEVVGSPMKDFILGCQADLHAGLCIPTVAANYGCEGFFGGLLASQQMTVFNAYASYEIDDCCKLGGTYQHGGQDCVDEKVKAAAGTWSVGGEYKQFRAKFTGDQTISLAGKYKDYKDVKLDIGGSYNVKAGEMGYGFTIEIDG